MDGHPMAIRPIDQNELTFVGKDGDVPQSYIAVLNRVPKNRLA